MRFGQVQALEKALHEGNPVRFRRYSDRGIYFSYTFYSQDTVLLGITFDTLGIVSHDANGDIRLVRNMLDAIKSAGYVVVEESADYLIYERKVTA